MDAVDEVIGSPSIKFPLEIFDFRTKLIEAMFFNFGVLL